MGKGSVMFSIPPFVDLLPCEKESAGVFYKVEDAGIVKTDRQKRIEGRDNDGRQKPELRQREHGDQQADADDADVTELPQPQRRLGFQVVWIDVHGIKSYLFNGQPLLLPQIQNEQIQCLAVGSNRVFAETSLVGQIFQQKTSDGVKKIIHRTPPPVEDVQTLNNQTPPFFQIGPEPSGYSSMCR